MNISARELDQRISIEAEVVNRNAINEEVRQWTEISNPWAKVTETPGREYLQADQTQGERKAVFKIRYDVRISPSHRLHWEGVVWEITAVTGTRREAANYLHCRSTEEVSE